MTWFINRVLFDHFKRMKCTTDIALVLATTFETVRPDNETLVRLAHAIQDMQVEPVGPVIAVDI